MEEFENKTCPNPDGFFPEITDSVSSLYLIN